MAPFKWSIIVFLGGILLLGLPIKAESETTTEETKPSSVKECRVHIEKALEQYWEQKEPTDHDTNSKVDKNEDDHHTSDALVDSNENQVYDKQQYEIVEEAKDEEKEYDDEGERDDGEETDDDVETDDEEDNEDVNGNGNHEEDNDTEEENIESPINAENPENEDDTKSKATENTELDDEAIDETEEDEEEEAEDDEDEEQEIEEEEEPDSSTGSADDNHSTAQAEQKQVREDLTDELKHFARKEEKNVEENISTINVEDERDDDENELDSEEEEDEDEDEDENVDEETDSEENTENESSTVEISDHLSINQGKDESDKVTGEADRASAGVASEFLDEKSSLKQPQASQVEKEAPNVTFPDTTDQVTTEPITQQYETGVGSSNETEDKGDDSIENIYEEDEDDDPSSGLTLRSRDHIDVILGLDEIGTEYEKEEEKLAQSIFREIKKIEAASIRPVELLFKYADSTTRVLGDAEIFNKPMLLFLGPWSAGKTTIINYLLGIERTPTALKTGTGITDIDFTLVTYGDSKRVISGTELAADWRYAGVQKFGQGFLDHFRSIHIPHTLLKKVTIVDTPGILENRKNTERGYPFNDAFQWFIDRADAIYVVLDPTKVDIGGELGSVIDQLKGRDVRFILNKADTIRRSDLMRVVGQLFWNLSPLMSSTEAPVIYAVSLTTKPYHPAAPAKFLADQEKNFLYDMKDTLDKRVENRILYARRHAVRVRNHAKMVDCYLATYYRHKSIFSSKKNVAKQITENPREYSIFDGLSSMTNVSRYDLPDPASYKEFFKLHPLYDFKPLASTCSYFRGCPMEKLDLAISKDFPELFAKYKKAKNISTDWGKQEGR